MPVLALLCAFYTTPLADFSGTYKGTTEDIEFELKLTQSDKSVSGRATSKFINFNLSGKVNGETAEGTMKPEGTGEEDKMFFKATLESGGLDMKIADPDDNGKANWAEADTIKFKRTGDAPTKTEGGEGKISKFVKKPTDTLGSGKEYTHASGGKFRYPSDWTLKEAEEGLILTPPDMVEGKEFFIITGEKAEGATDPTSKIVADYLNQAVNTVAPGAKRVGGIEPAAAGNAKGGIYTWDGTVNGQESRIRAYVTILKGYGISLVAVGPKDKVEARDKQLRSIFYTFGWGQGKIDQRIVGKWQFYSYKSGRETKATAVLGADGTFSYDSSSEFSANLSGKDSGGNELWTGWVNSRGGSGWKGTWFADGSEITLNFEDGTSETWDYRFEQQGTASVMILTGSDPKKPFEWSKIG